MNDSSCEEENAKLMERVQLALLGYNAGIYEWNMLDNSAYYSNEWKKMLGYDDKEVLPLLSFWKNLVHPDDIKPVMNNVQKAVARQEKSVEAIHRVKHKDGHWIWILGRGFIKYDSVGNPLKMVGIHTDITEQKTKELKRKHLAQIIEQTHDSIISIDLDGIIKTFNRGSAKLFGYSAEEIIGKHISVLKCYDESVDFSHIIEVLKLHEQLHQEMHFRTKDAKPIYVDLSTSILKDEDDKVIAIVGFIQDITQKKEIQEKILQQKERLDYQAHHDYLTNLPNRILFHDRLEQSIRNSKREQSETALFFIDLDHFKEINDLHGHDIGDEVLKEVAKRLSSVIREHDTLSRLGGDEFTIIVDGFTHVEDISRLAKKVLSKLEEPIFFKEIAYKISSSIGIAIYPDDDTDSAKEMLKYADTAMYKAKMNGRNNFQYYNDPAL